jgi:hypothetical protein
MRPMHRPNVPADFEHIFLPLRSEIAYLHGVWIVYQDLFGSPESAKACEITPGGFSIIHYALRRELVMGISRITDPKQSVGKENLTLKQLYHQLEEYTASQELLANLDGQLTAIDQFCKPIRDLRNRIIGHLDLRTALKQHAQPLPTLPASKSRTRLTCWQGSRERFRTSLPRWSSITICTFPHRHAISYMRSMNSCACCPTSYGRHPFQREA